MIVRNEADRYLEQVLRSARRYIRSAVIIDDASTDNTAELCQDVLHDIPLHLVRNRVSRFSDESSLRKQQWDETVRTQPQWILVLDADEQFEDRASDELNRMTERIGIDAYRFPIYDFWDELHYREDPYWYAHMNHRPLLFRYRADLDYRWRETPVHCGRTPITVWEFEFADSDLRVKHFGWASEESRRAKYARYKGLDPEGRFGSMEQYESILDQHPNLVRWQE